MSRTLPPHSELIKHPTGQTTRIIIDDFTPPWLPPEQKQTILIQPGFGRHADFWYHWIPTLATHYRVIRRDLRGHGYSSVPDVGSSYTYNEETILGEIVDLLDQLGIAKVHFLGESTGGMVGLAFAARYPERVSSLILCATPTHLPPEFIELCSMGYGSWAEAVRNLGSRGWMEALSKEPGSIGQTDSEYTKWWLEQVGVNPSEGLALYAEWLSKLDVSVFQDEVSRNGIGKRTLILAPTSSRMTGIEDQRSYSGKVQGCKIVEIGGRGHEIFVDKAEACQGALLDFLKKLEE
ncbi:hypothetical protein H2200_005552 [Cladophialophora chaetospira]|uniref:AB hydrolase-1 domain-containing protein n=1 Tax=Cladophialophora chaetospira TaxID=386627 RepID=A0AA38XC83_9EURO|nr:hypothetical protein H2200_005552 [Cladophialophora chaetospira]